MRFHYPSSLAEFEIPDSWWHEAGMVGFTPAGHTYKSATPGSHIVPLSEIEPILQSERPPLDRRGFRKNALIYFLTCIAGGSEIPPVVLRKLERASTFKYELHGGFHRFHAAVAVGFESIPAKFYDDLSAEECFDLS